MRELPEEFSNCYMLKKLDLLGNKLTFLPTEFGNMCKLQFVNIGTSQVDAITHTPQPLIWHRLLVAIP